MKTIVVSGVNLFKAGSLKVIRECIAVLSAYAGNNHKIIALVHNENQYEKYDNVEYISFPKSRKSYLFRLYYEYIGFYNLSKKWKPDYWFSMHDATPNVVAKRRFVYCHNSFPFYKPQFKDILVQPSIVILSLFSKYIFKTNIKKNNYVVVQQEWTRKAFEKMFSINNVIVALPINSDTSVSNGNIKISNKSEETVFFYPMTPMIHKNLEIIGEAVQILKKNNINNFKIILTSNGAENKYAKYIYKKYGSSKNIVFRGLLSKEEINQYYMQCDCLIFPSKTESWGLPLTEAKEYDKPILASSFPYAYEAIGKYDKAKFFNPDNPQQLANIMKDFISNEIQYDGTEDIKYESPFFNNWTGLIGFLFREL